MVSLLRSSRQRYQAYRDEVKKRRRDPKATVDTSFHGASDGKPKKPRSRPFTRLFKSFWGLLAGHRWMLLWVGVLVGMSTLIGLTPYYGTKIVVGPPSWCDMYDAVSANANRGVPWTYSGPGVYIVSWTSTGL